MIKIISNYFILLMAASSFLLWEYKHALLNWEPQVQSQKQELWELL